MHDTDGPLPESMFFRLEEQLERHLAAARDHYIGFLQQMLRIPTPRMQEHKAVRFAAHALEQAGCRVEVFEGEGQGEATPDGRPINAFTRRPGTGQGRSLLLEAHLDTVPSGDPRKWRRDPWSAEIEDGRIYARGAHDDRVGAAILWMVVDSLNRLGVQTRGDLYLLITTEEEFSCGGMKAYVNRREHVVPDAHLLVDGNGQSHLCILAHPAVVSFQIRIAGPFVSSQRRDLTHEGNPIELMSALVQALREFEAQTHQKLAQLQSDSRWPSPFVVVTEIQSSGWISNIAEECIAKGLASIPPPLTIPEYKQAFERFIEAASTAFHWLRLHPPQISWGPLEVPAVVTREDSTFFKVLSEAHQKNFGTELIGRYIGGWGDIGLLRAPEILFYGPGGGGGDHSYDEYYELQDLAPMVKTLVHLVVNWCGTTDHLG